MKICSHHFHTSKRSCPMKPMFTHSICCWLWRAIIATDSINDFASARRFLYTQDFFFMDLHPADPYGNLTLSQTPRSFSVNGPQFMTITAPLWQGPGIHFKLCRVNVPHLFRELIKINKKIKITGKISLFKQVFKFKVIIWQPNLP